MKNKLFSLGKIIISCGLIFILFSIIKTNNLTEAISKTELIFVLLGIAMYGLAQPILAHRWLRILNNSEIKISLFEAMRLNFIGIFTSNFLPGIYSGDIVKPLYLLNRYPDHKIVLYASVLFERVCGVITIIIMSLISSCWIAFVYNRWYFLILSLVLFVAIGVGFSILNWVSKPRRIIPGLIGKLLNIGNQFAGKILFFAKNKRLTLEIVLWSILAQSFMIFMYWLFLIAVGVKINPLALSIAASLAWLVSMIPVTLNGLGLREGSMVYFLNYFEVPSHIASVAIILGIAPTIIFSIFGAFFSISKIEVLKLNKSDKPKRKRSMLNKGEKTKY